MGVWDYSLASLSGIGPALARDHGAMLRAEDCEQKQRGNHAESENNSVSGKSFRERSGMLHPL